MSDPYPYNGRLSRWEEVAPGLAIVGVESLDPPFAFEPGQYATLGLANADGKLIQRPMSISSSADNLSEYGLTGKKTRYAFFDWPAKPDSPPKRMAD